MALEFQRNSERFQFLRWGQDAFDGFRVVPPGTGIVHQVNIEHLARVVMTNQRTSAYPDTCVGTDSHTTMENGLGILGWGVGGIEAEAAMLGQPISMLIPRVVGFRLTGALPAATTATDLVLTITQILRKHGVVGKFVEFYGDGVAEVPVANRATIGNMSPEFGSTCAIFPIDQATIDYLTLTGRSDPELDLVEKYAKAQGLWHDPSQEPRFSEQLTLDLGTVVPSIAGPKRPQDKIELTNAKTAFRDALPAYTGGDGNGSFPASDPGEQEDVRPTHEVKVTLDDGSETTLDHGHVVIAAITSCTNTSNPFVMIGAALLAKKAVEKGLSRKPWVKTTLAPGSKVVMDYYERAGLIPYLDKLGFNLVGYGCTTCIGNSGPLPTTISEAVNDNDLTVVSVLSGNRNFEGRINPDVKMNYLASPPLVVAYALAGTMDIDLDNEPLGTDQEGNQVFLKDIWPSPQEVQNVVAASVAADMFTTDYADVFNGDDNWRGLEVPTGDTFDWDAELHLRRPAALLRRHAGRARAGDRHPRRQGPGQARRLGHHRPHLAGRRDQGHRPGGPLPDRARHRPEGLQLLRLPPRQPRGDDPRNVRQHPAPQPARARHRGRRHQEGRPGDVDLRRLPRLHRRGHPARRHRRQGVRLGLLPRLGGEGHRAARRPGRAGRVVRAHPPVQPDRHGRAPAPVQGGRERRVARPHRPGGLRHHRHRGAQPGHHADRGHGHRRRQALHRHRADRHPRRGRLLPARRHHAVRAPLAARARSSKASTRQKTPAATVNRHVNGCRRR